LKEVPIIGNWREEEARSEGYRPVGTVWSIRKWLVAAFRL
jgi:hypothetical protein